MESNLRAHYKTHQNNLLQVSGNKTIESLIMKGKASGYKPKSQQQAILPASALPVSLSSNLAAALLPATSNEPKLNSLLGGGTGLLTTLNNLDSFKHLFGQTTEPSKEPNRHGTLIGGNLFSSLLNGALNQGNNSLNQQTNQLNNQLNCQLNGPMPDRLVPNILNSITNGLNSSAASLPLTPTDSPTYSSSPSLPWMNSHTLKATALKATTNNKNNGAKGKSSPGIDLVQGAKNDSVKNLKDDLQNLTGSLLMANNLIPAICPTNGVDPSSLQQQLNNFLMATTAAQLLSLKYK